MKIFGYTFIKSSDLSKLKGDYLNQKLEYQYIESELEKIKKLRSRIDVKLGDPAPIDQEKRAQYVSMVADLHKEILKPKLLQMISTSQFLLSGTDNTRELDLNLKGAIYAFWEILHWGDRMTNEQVANQNN